MYFQLEWNITKCSRCVIIGVVDTNFHDSYGFERNGPEYQAVMNGFAKMHPIGRIGQVINSICLGVLFPNHFYFMIFM